MKKIVLLFAFSISIFSSKAEEGMLIPSLIAAFESDMRAMGMKLSAEDIYSVNKSSLKDAILHFGGGCTAELVSGQGLLLTNHHCGYSQIQSHSSLENDYIKYGFWAKTKADELPNTGLTASRIVRIEDVTEIILKGTEGLSEKERQQKIIENARKIEEDAVRGNHYSAQVKPFNYGNDFYMIVKETFEDVRLVGAPPSSIGKFGGDTDNWVWPRHTGDFAVFRVYAGANNQPAEYNTSNQPYQPLHFLPVSIKDRVPGEFTMVYGFPGSTEQHLSSEHLKFIMDKERPARIKMRDQSLAAINASMKSSDLLRIKYASKQARIANGWKKWIGQIGGLQTVDAIQIKLDREKEFQRRADSKPEWKTKYGKVIPMMNELAKEELHYEFAYSMGVEYMFIGAEVFKLTRGFHKMASQFETYSELGTVKEQTDKITKGLDGFFKDYDWQTDKNIFLALTKEYKNQMGELPQVGMLAQSAEDLTEKVYAQSVFVDKEKYKNALESLTESSLQKLQENDPALKLWTELYDYFFADILPYARGFSSKMDYLLRTYVAGRKEMFPKEKLWPDANSTMRITYGKLEGSAPHDGMAYTEHTTLEGIVAKNNSGHSDFELLPEFRKLIESKDYGEYAQDGELWVCFTGSNHTTGGNSGSPVIDAHGNLMGLNFDRSWESTMSDFMFDPNRCRNIVVDIRYVLWIMDKYADSKHLVDEMTIVRGKSKKKRCKKKKS